MLVPSFRIELRIPGETVHLRAPRLVAASTATMLGYDVDGLWEVRCAVDELCGVLVKHGCPRIDLVFANDPGGCLEVNGTGQRGHRGQEGSGRALEKVDELAGALLDAVTASWELSHGARAVRFTARFRAPGGGAVIARSDEKALPH